MKKSVLILFVLCQTILWAQEEEKKFGIEFSGFVKNDMFFDTRQTFSAREGHFLLWPLPVAEDINGDDMNAGMNFNILAIQSRLTGSITGPDAFGAKTSGTIEGDFFAQANDNINLFRLRHAFMKLKWENSYLIMGQYWNPFFVTSCFANTLSFNTGTPFQAFARNPQIRFAYTAGGIEFTAAALSQRDYASKGPDGSSMLRNSGLPDLHAQVQYTTDALAAGAGISYKQLLPQHNNTITDTVAGTTGTIVSSDKVSGLSVIAFAKYTAGSLTMKIENLMGQNLSDVLHVSGFAIIDQNIYEGTITYESIKSNSTWVDINYATDKFDVGLFGGYYMKLGTTSEIVDPSMTIYGLGNNIANMVRLSPRAVFKSGKTKLGLELEYDAVEYGASYDEHAVPTDLTSADNVRLLFSAIYSF